MNGKDLRPYAGSLPVTAGDIVPVRRQPKPLPERLLGAVALMALLFPWAFGGFIPLVTIYSFLNGYAIVGTVLCCIIVLPYFVPNKRIGWWSDFLLRGADYFAEHSLVVTEPFGSERPFLACYSPHGIVSFGYAYNAGLRKEFAGVLGISAPAIRHIPLCNLVFKATGATIPSDKRTMLKYMEQRRNLGIIPGGFEEATITSAGCDRVFLKNRKGFIKYAMQYGYDVVPIFTFGDTEAYCNAQGWWKTRLHLNKMHIPTVVPFGAAFFPLLPRPSAKLHTVTGKVLRLPYTPRPSKDEINKYHDLYICRLRELYDEYKSVYGYGHRQLEIW